MRMSLIFYRFKNTEFSGNFLGSCGELICNGENTESRVFIFIEFSRCTVYFLNQIFYGNIILAICKPKSRGNKKGFVS